MYDIYGFPNPEERRKSEEFGRKLLFPVGHQNDLIGQQRRAFEAHCNTFHEALKMSGSSKPGCRHPADMDAETESGQSGAVVAVSGPSGE